MKMTVPFEKWRFEGHICVFFFFFFFEGDVKAQEIYINPLFPLSPPYYLSNVGEP